MDTPEKRMGVPRTPAEIDRLLAERPDGWEYLLFAGALLLGRDALNAKLYDHELRIGHVGERELDLQSAAHRLTEAFGAIQGSLGHITAVFDSDVQRRAFGAPGEAGDAERIQHLAGRIVSGYDALLDWAADLRGLRVPDRAKPAIETASNLANQPIDEIREFIDDVVRQTDELPAAIAADEPVAIRVSLVLTVDKTAEAAFYEALHELEAG